VKAILFAFLLASCGVPAEVETPPTPAPAPVEEPAEVEAPAPAPTVEEAPAPAEEEPPPNELEAEIPTAGEGVPPTDGKIPPMDGRRMPDGPPRNYNKDLKGDAESCLKHTECRSRVCEGQGCTDDKPGKCMPQMRACTRDRRPFCGCDGQTFWGSSSCINQRYEAPGECAP